MSSNILKIILGSFLVQPLETVTPRSISEVLPSHFQKYTMYKTQNQEALKLLKCICLFTFFFFFAFYVQRVYNNQFVLMELGQQFSF